MWEKIYIWYLTPEICDYFKTESFIYVFRDDC